MGDMLEKKNRRGRGYQKKKDYLRAISLLKTVKIFFVGKGVSTPQKLCTYLKICNKKTMISFPKK